MNKVPEATKGATEYPKIDQKNGNNLVRIVLDEEWNSAFRTKYGHLYYPVMPFGLTNASVTSQAMMITIVENLINDGVVIYFDDILIYSNI